MSFIKIIIVIFSILGAVDYVFGNRIGLGKEFEKAFMLLGTMSLSMIGMIIIAPCIAEIITPFSEFIYRVFGVDPSIIPSIFLANDMGGASLSMEMAQNSSLGKFNALIVSSMMGCTVSFTIPFALGVVDKSLHRELFMGLMCGIITIPIGCFVSGLVCNISVNTLATELIPLVLFSGLLVLGLIYASEKCIRLFQRFGTLIRIVIMIGLGLGIVRYLTGIEILTGIATIEEGSAVCLNAAIVLSGAFPFMYISSRLLSIPLNAIGRRIGVNEIAILGILSSFVTSVIAFGTMDKMDKRGIIANAAFAVSGAFVFGSHMAFTMAFDDRYLGAVIIGKIVSGMTAIILSIIMYEKKYINRGV